MAEQPMPAPEVSSDAEELILVDSGDLPLGHATKAACHDGQGILHRAFSLFVFNAKGELLVQQRAPGKRLWPGYWANTCCSHPRRGETREEAAHRRLEQELGMRCALRYLFKFEYHAEYRGLGAERELCSVFVGVSDAAPQPNPNEIAAWRYVRPEDLDAEIAAHPDRFTPWLKIEWRRLRDDFDAALRALQGGAPR